MLASFNIGTMMSQENQIKNIPIDMLETYHNHKFQLYTGERLDDMVESIKANGILLPIIVQPLSNGNYEILSGHNRTNAAKIAGLETVPAVIKEKLTEDEAEMYVIETNLSQRGFNDLRISEQATVLAMRHSKMFSEEKRQQIAEELEVMEGKSKSKLEKTGEEYGLKKDTVARLLRVDKLIPEMKAWVDDKQLPTIKPDGVHKAWQTATSKKTSRLAFNLWNNFTGTVNEETDKLNDSERNYTVDEIFCCKGRMVFKRL